ncbi:hypothetical protein Q9966_004879 [Columba livia]|nr:hypothetical protein Q9966_004879 [Columba livia]
MGCGRGLCAGRMARTKAAAGPGRFRKGDTGRAGGTRRAGRGPDRTRRRSLLCSARSSGRPRSPEGAGLHQPQCGTVAERQERRRPPRRGEPGVREARPRLAKRHRRVPAAAAEADPGARRGGGGEQRAGNGGQDSSPPTTSPCRRRGVL